MYTERHRYAGMCVETYRRSGKGEYTERHRYAGMCVETYRGSCEGVYREIQVHRYVYRDIPGLR